VNFDRPRLRRWLTERAVVVLSLAVDPISTAESAEWYASLNPVERQRAQSFYFESDRQAYVTAHALLRHSLSAVIPCDPVDWRFVTGPFGKLQLADPPSGFGLRFNLSHCRTRVAVALALDVEVGVDVEALDRTTRIDPAIADAYFAPDEAAALRAMSDETRRREQFLRLWTLKEACIKATGRGLSQSLDGFSVDPDRLSVRSQSLPMTNWRLAQWRVAEHLVAVAADWPGREPPVFVHCPLSTARSDDQ
jgi:4'-phosphopantetheinyl transferase